MTHLEGENGIEPGLLKIELSPVTATTNDNGAIIYQTKSRFLQVESDTMSRVKNGVEFFKLLDIP